MYILVGRIFSGQAVRLAPVIYLLENRRSLNSQKRQNFGCSPSAVTLCQSKPARNQPTSTFNCMQKHQPVIPPCACLFLMHRSIEAAPSIRPHASMHSTCAHVISYTTAVVWKHGAAHNHAQRAESPHVAPLLPILPHHLWFRRASAFLQPTTRHQRKHHNGLVTSPCRCATKLRQKPALCAVPLITF